MRRVRAAGERVHFYGGQAVIEGVMMRGRRDTAVAVRRPDGTVTVRMQPIALRTSRGLWLKIPLVRGTAALIESLVLGTEALMFSANEAVGEDQKLGKGGTAGALILAVVLAVGLFMLLPTWAAGVLRRVIPGPTLLNVAEGVIRLGLLIGYIAVIGLLPDVKRLFRYHGAEHKVLHAQEAGRPTLEGARPMPVAHPRCGTSFLLLVAVVSVIVFALCGWPGLLVRTLTRLALLPVVAGASYEVIRLSGRSKSRAARIAAAPGMWLQVLTTAQPDDAQLEVALTALEALLKNEESAAAKAAG